MNEGSNEGLCRLKVVIILGHLRAAVLDYVFDERLEEGEERLGFLRVGDEYVGALDDARHKRCNLCSRLQVYTACERQSEYASVSAYASVIAYGYVCWRWWLSLRVAATCVAATCVAALVGIPTSLAYPYLYCPLKRLTLSVLECRTAFHRFAHCRTALPKLAKCQDQD